jgi:hypothetical protein
MQAEAMTDSAPNGIDAGLILWMAEDRVRRGEYIEPSEVADLLPLLGDAPLPGWLRDLTSAHLRGEAKRPRGRPPQEDAMQPIFLALARRDYHRMRRLLERRARRRKRPRSTSRLDGPPHERALELIHEHYRKFGHFKLIGRDRLRDLISSS